MSQELLGQLWLGAAVGAPPTVAMIVMSLFVYQCEVSKSFEAMAQSLCAGLIIGAVGKELFPRLADFNNTDVAYGLTLGFLLGFALINFQEYVEEWCERMVSCLVTPDKRGSIKSRREIPQDGEDHPLVTTNAPNYQATSSGAVDEEGGESEGETETDMEDGEHPILLLGSQVISSPTERSRMRNKVSDLMSSIRAMQSKAQALFSSSDSVSSAEAEILADQIDEDIHKLHYILDHCRRLLQGSGSNLKSVVPRIWITDRGRLALHSSLSELHEGANRIASYLGEGETTRLNRTALITMHTTMGSMDDQISRLHHTVEGYSLKWGRRLKKTTHIPSSGSRIPLDLLVPVVVDCIMDGFLLGTTVSFSGRAGLILSVANCIEMGFLGMAVSVRVQKCTTSSACARHMSIIMPPLLMLGAALVGSFLGFQAQAHPVAYVTFVSFGIVTLMYLALNELLVEAREAIKGAERWYTGLVVFAGMYAVLVMDLVLP